MPILDDRNVETEGLIREYQRNATQSTIRLMEFYGGEDWRKSEGAGMKRCIQNLVEKELVTDYQRDSGPDEETRGALEERVGAKGEKTKG